MYGRAKRDSTTISCATSETPLASQFCLLPSWTTSSTSGTVILWDMDRALELPPRALEALNRILSVAKPERVVLFGSWARAEADADSDLDLLVVLPLTEPRHELALRLLQALADLPVPKDLIVLSPEEWETKRHLPGTIAYPADREGLILYAI